MDDDVKLLSEQLLANLANSIHERSDVPGGFAFRLPELLIVEEFILELLKE